MFAYIVRRLLLIAPTLLAIMMINFVIVQFVPGGPVERILAELEGTAVSATARVAGSGSEVQTAGESLYRGAQGLPDGFVEKLERMYGLDKPPVERFLLMMENYLTFDFGESAFRSRRVVDLIIEKMPVSISLDCGQRSSSTSSPSRWGIAKARRDGSAFDVWTSGTIILGYAIPDSCSPFFSWCCSPADPTGSSFRCAVSFLRVSRT